MLLCYFFWWFGLISDLSYSLIDIECIRETEEDWDEDIAEETKDECSKFGEVKHIFVDKESQVMCVCVCVCVCVQSFPSHSRFLNLCVL